MKRFIILLITILSVTSCTDKITTMHDIPSTSVIPSKSQVVYQRMERVGFIHFGMNTFTDKEWGYGDEDPAIFNPAELDADQWARTAKEGGLKELILTAKHHDGFCLWPSKYTEHSIKNSTYKDGKGDIVKELTDACRKYGLKVGLYLSPWDRNNKDYGKPEYIEYYRNQLTELLTNYGEINEIWFDGANGGDGYYGGASEVRTIDRETYYDWDNTFKLVKSLQPDILIFSDAGPDIRWVGNENGFAGETFWSTISKHKLVIGASDPDYLNTGDPLGDKWIIGQCDVSIRPGWFYHKSQDIHVKSPSELVKIYNKSVGRNGVMLINIPPDKNGLIAWVDSLNLSEFNKQVQNTFKSNLAVNAKITANNIRFNNDYFSPSNLLDSNDSTYWAADDGINSADIILEFNEPIEFDRMVLQEPIKYGQRISKFKVFSENSDNDWQLITEGTTIGYKRILVVDRISTNKIKLVVEESFEPIALSEIRLYNSLD